MISFRLLLIDLETSAAVDICTGETKIVREGDTNTCVTHKPRGIEFINGTIYTSSWNFSSKHTLMKLEGEVPSC